MRDSTACSSSPVGWYQGPNTYGADGAGWRPTYALIRRRASAGRGPPTARSRRRAAAPAEGPRPEARGGPGPAPRPPAAQRPDAALGALDQHPVAGRRQQPRHRVVGGVIARVEAPGRHELRDHRTLVLLVGALGHVVLHLAAALVHRVRALAAAEIALPAPR